MPDVKLQWSGNALKPEDDDISGRYLLTRQVAHEYHHPAVQNLIQADRAAQQAAAEAAMTEMESFRKGQKQQQEKGKALESSFAAGLSEQQGQGAVTGELQPAHGEPAQPPLKPSHTSLEAQGEAQKETQGLEQPNFDPTMSFGAGLGAGFSLSLATGKALMPSLGRAITSGVVNVAADLPISAGADVLEVEAPELVLPFTVATSLLSAGTIEPAIERGIMKSAAKVGKILSPEEVKAQVQAMKRILASESGMVGKDISAGSKKQNIIKAYNELKAERGYGNIEIADIRDKAGVSQEEISAALKQMSKDGEAVMALGERSAVDDRIRSGGVAFEEGQEPNLLVRIDAGQEVDKETLKSVVDEINAEIGKHPVKDALKILKSQKGEITIRTGTPPAPVKGGKSGIPQPPADMAAKSEKVLANTNPDITTAYAGEATGGNLRIWSEDLRPKFLDDIESPEDIMRVLSSTQEVFAEQKQAAARGVQTWADTETGAKKYGVADMLGRRVGQAFNDQQIEAGRQMLETSAGSLKKMADVVRSGQANDLQKMDFMRAFQTHYAIQMQMSGIAAEAGRALQIFRKMAQSTPLRQAQLQEFMDGLHGKVNPEYIAEQLSKLDNPAAVSNYVKQAAKATSIDMFNEAFINGLLWLPTTHMANITSNFITDVMSIGERYTAAMISKTPFIGSGQISLDEAQSYAYGMMKASSDAFRMFAKVLRSGEASETMTKIDLAGTHGKAITGENVAGVAEKARQKLGGTFPTINKMSPVEFEEGSHLKRGIDFLGNAIRTPGRFLLAEDDMFKMFAYRAELEASSLRKAKVEFKGNVDASKKYLQDMGVDTASLKDDAIIKQAISNRAAEIVSDPQALAPEVHLGARNNARYLTYTNPIDNKIIKNIQGSRNPFLKMMIPFTGTPYNIFRYSMERTPLVGLFLKSMREDLAAGGARRDLALAKQAIGTMLWGAAVGLVMSGNVHGFGPRDKNKRQAWLRDGHKPYSVEIGDTVIEYGRAEPWASIFGIAADGAEILGYGPPEMAAGDKVFSAFLAATTKNYTSKTFLQGVAEGIDALYNGEEWRWQELIKSKAKAMMPFSSLVRGVEQTMSPEREEAETVMEALRSQIPWLSDDLPKQRDLWGRTLSKEIEKDESILETMYRVVSPIYISKRKDSPIDKELVTLKRGLPMPRREQSFHGDIGGKSVPIELDPAQYEKFITLMNKIPLDSTGTTLKKSLDAMVKTDPTYKDLRDPDDKIKMIQDKVKEAVILAKRKLYETDTIIKESVDMLQLEQLNAQ